MPPGLPTMKGGGSHLRENFPLSWSFRGRASSRANEPAGYAAGASHATRGASPFIIFSCFFPYFISQFVNYRLWRRKKTPVAAFYPDRLRIAYAGAKLVCPVLVQPVGADIKQQIERGMQALVRHPGVFAAGHLHVQGASWHCAAVRWFWIRPLPRSSRPWGKMKESILIFPWPQNAAAK